MIGTQFNNIFFPSDENGTGQWRGIWPIQTIWAMGPSTGINTSVLTRVTVDKKFYEGLNMFMIQRFVNESQEHFFNNLIVPYSKMYSFWTVYNIDDAMHYKDIVKYNRGRRAFLGEDTQARIKKMLNSADFVLTTTDYIKNYYHRTYDVPLENIIAIPNYLPRWWIGDYYNKDESLNNFKNCKRKPRVAVVSSLSHYNVDHIKEDPTGSVVWAQVPEGVDPSNLKIDENTVWKNERGEVVDINTCHEVDDDLDIILDCIKKTLNEVQWIFFGYAPPRLQEYIKAGKIEYHPGVSILNYPSVLHNLRLNAIIAPVKDCEFNRCKSNIKWLEACAIGVPLYAQNIPTYSNYMPELQLFNDSTDLYEKLMKLKNMSAGCYESIITKQWHWLNSPHNECGISSPNWWMEDNIGPWMNLFKMRNRAQELSLAKYIEVSKQHEADKMLTAEDGVEIIK